MKTGRRRWSAALALALTCLTSAAVRADDVKLDAPALEGLQARAIGPAAMSGRIAAIDGYVGSRQTLFVGAAGGGLWKSRDGGVTFKPIFDKYNQSIGAIRVSPADTNTIWVGTGESWTRNSVSVGDGVYKSTDGGDSWQNVGLGNSEHVSKIEVNPKHPDVVFVGALGALWNDSVDRGVYRTKDGGKTWDKVLYVDATTGCADLAIDPENPDIVYAAMWQFRRKPWAFVSGGPSSALYRSEDGGTTWKKVGGGLPTGLMGRIAVTIAPTQPTRVFAVVETQSTALWRSDDRGATWQMMNSSAGVQARPFYFCSMVADPKDPNRLYKQGFDLTYTEDGGKTFAPVGGYHGDTHALWINPNDANHLVLGTDGGVYISNDRGNNWRFVGTLPVSQFYHVSYDMETPYNVYGGIQDNGSWTAPSRVPGGIGNRHWKNTGGGDGFWSWPDPFDHDIVYCEYQGGNVLRFRKSTNETKEIKPFRGAGEPDYRWNWNTPIAMSPTKQGTMYLGAQFLFKSTDRGENWTRISPDLTTNDPTKQRQEQSGGVSLDNSSAENHCTIYAVSESPKDANVVWAGTDDGNVQVTRDGGKSWTNVTKNITGRPPFTWVSYIRATQGDPGSAYVTFDGHALGDRKPYVYLATEYGKTWKALATDDIKGYAHTVIEDPVNPKLLFVGTEFGLFCSLNGGASWAQMKGNLPNVAVRDLAIQPRDGDLLIATHGRGIYIIDDLTPLRTLTPEVLNSDASFLASRPATMTIPASEQRFDGADQFVGDSPDETAPITYYLKKRHVFGDLKLEVYDPAGKLITTIQGGKRRGINRLEWSMRQPPPKVPPAANLVPQQYSFVGPRVPPGDYQLKLIRGDQTLESQLKLVPDPRATYTAEDRAQQQKTVNELYNSLGDLTYLVDNVTRVRDQARTRAQGLKPADALAKSLAAFASQMETVRQDLVATKEGRITGEEKLREKLGQLYGAVNGFDGRPTGSQLAYQQTLTADLAAAQKKFDDAMAKQLPGLNASLAKQKLEAVQPVSREEWNKTR